MDPSGDDMDRDLCKRIKDISAKLNVDRFLATKFVSPDNKKRTSGEDYLRELTVNDIEIGHLEYMLVKAKREDDYKDPTTGQKVYGRNTILNNIRIRQSEIIARCFPDSFPHLVPVTKKEEDDGYFAMLSKGQKKVHFERVAVTEDQIIRYDLPNEPRDTKTADKIENDPRYRNHIEKYGN